VRARMTRCRAAVVLAALLAAAAAAAAQEPGPGTADSAGPPVPTIARNCLGCHGPEGVSPGAMPTLAGKTADYVARRLMEFRDGARPSTIMGRIMKPFADEDIQKIAAYFAAETVEVNP